MLSVRRDPDKPNTSILGIPPEASVIGVSSRNWWFWFKWDFSYKRFYLTFCWWHFSHNSTSSIHSSCSLHWTSNLGCQVSNRGFISELSLVMHNFNVHLNDFVTRWFGWQYKSCSVSRLECCTGTLSTRSVYNSLMSKLALKVLHLFNTVGIRLHWDSSRGSVTAGRWIPAACRSCWFHSGCRSITELHLW